VQEIFSQLKTDGTDAQRIVASLKKLPKIYRVVFLFSGIVFLISSVVLASRLIDTLLVEIPKHGGSIVEGIVGRPRFINPVIAKSDADRDMAELIYSGLLKATPTGDFIPDLAESYDITDDGLTYRFVLRPDLYWHDGVILTSHDVAYTIEKIRDPGLAIKSPKRASWEGVTVETPDDRTVTFSLKQPFAPFIEATTMGIIPKHIWENVPSEEFDVTHHNMEPIGSGPYRIAKIVRDDEQGLPRWYDLVAFKRHSGGEPYITNIRIQFFGNNKELAAAYASGVIDQMHTIEPGFAAELETKGASITNSPLPRVFAVYFNQNQQTLFVDKTVRQALNLAVDKERIVKEILFGYGRTIDGPIPPPLLETAHADAENATSTNTGESLLVEAGWVKNAAGIFEKTNKKTKQVTLLEFSLAVPDVPELRQAAELMKEDWEKLGASVTLKVYESSTLTSEILSPRKYDALFYGQIVGRIPDPFAYWHSSQRNAPGLNISLYANKNVDKLLEEMRKENDQAKREESLMKFSSTISEDIPAIFLYSPDFLYATSPNVRGRTTGLFTMESDRFLDIKDWYLESERVWKFFVGK
jgi:peptide/nickel transport system substrate-binding protein